MDNQEFEIESYLFGANAAYVEELLTRYHEDPASVDASWREVFDRMASQPSLYPDWAPKTHKIIGVKNPDAEKPVKPAKRGAKPAAAVDEKTILESLSIYQMIHAYRVRGHLLADLDPLKQEAQKYHPELDPKNYGFGESDLDHEVLLNGLLGKKKGTVREVLNILRKTYCSTIGFEFMHIQYPDQKAWIQKRIEDMEGDPKLDKAEKLSILDTLIEVESFEEFLQVKYPGVKRFSVQGGDAMVAGLEAAISQAGQHKVQDIVFGMPHRGRLNVLTTIMGKPYAEMLSLFHGNLDFPEDLQTSGDVKYHLGASGDREFDGGHKMHLSLTANPSHLEVVNPVVCGKVRAKMDQIGDVEKRKALGVQLHGDAAFAGQGSVAETLALSELRSYRTGGSLHVIVNNQIGFTTSPAYSRFTPYPSDVAKMVQAPIFHVNGDDPEAVAAVCRMAIDFRQEFQRDVVVDVICYRKYGHNEADEPMFTQPLMYKKVQAKTPPVHIYAEQLVAEGVLSKADVDKEFATYKAFFEEQYEVSNNYKRENADWLEGQWQGFIRPADEGRDEPVSGVDKKKLQALGEKITAYPKDFNINKKLARIIKTRGDVIAAGEGIDWATAEALAFASLADEGRHVRLSGQDCGRGTFSQRHSVLVDQEDASRFMPLNHIREGQGKYEVIDSSLSELAILGFEYGYSLAEPNAFVAWEAQFGDFANGAQMIIDQFITSGESKWLRMSGLVMLLPHGYEGMGPEHSSARIERFLQMCAEDNMQVVNCSTPASYYHALRRQLCNDFRKPLVVFTPKSLLRHKRCVSSIEEMGAKTRFHKLITEHEKLNADAKIRRVVITSGKVYYDLLAYREENNIKDVAILRLEQYYPFPHKALVAELKRYKNAEICWTQEEPKNMGAWSFVRSYIEDAMDDVGRGTERIIYAGRKAAASPATGYAKVHEREQNALVEEALKEKKSKAKKAS